MPQPTATRPAVVSRPPSSNRRPGYTGPRRASSRPAPPPAPAGRSNPGGKFNAGKSGDKPEHEILFQKYFKSANPQRTYAAQVKKANNGNHYLVLTEGKRDDATGEVRKTRLFIFSEVFKEYFNLLQATAQFIRANPVPAAVKAKRDKFWAKKAAETPAPAAPASGAP
jgi:hypothetical protein